MAITYIRCNGTGFLNLDQIDPDVYGQDVCDSSDGDAILKWIKAHDGHCVSRDNIWTVNVDIGREIIANWPRNIIQDAQNTIPKAMQEKLLKHW